MYKRHIVRLIRLVNTIEDWLLVSMLAFMVTLAVAQIIYRNIAGGSVVWIDPMLRTLVLWVALSGAVIASRHDNHIRIDFFARYISGKYYIHVKRLVHFYCALVCGFIAWHSVGFVLMDYEFATIAFAGIPAWITELIIPIAFGMMAVRYFLLFLSPPRSHKR
ncbi:MAG: TRAP transporter small permease [Gammaproteobacteria bacterium]|jgi:TRAP-type C4-dicarboxylate transport system permease small subunit